MEGARPFRDADRPQCVALLRQAFDAARALRGGPAALAALAGEPGRSGPHEPDAGALVASWRSDTIHHVLVGTVDDEVVGVAAGHYVRGGNAKIGVVDVVYVEPDARGVGVGTAMAQSLLDWFAAEGCHGVDAPALPGDRESKQLFESFGLSARLLVLHRALP